MLIKDIVIRLVRKFWLNINIIIAIINITCVKGGIIIRLIMFVNTSLCSCTSIGELFLLIKFNIHIITETYKGNISKSQNMCYILGKNTF